MGMLLHDFFFSFHFFVLTNNSTAAALSVLLLTTLVVVDRAPRLGRVLLAVLHAAAASARDALAFLDVPRLMTNGGAQGVLRGAGVKGGARRAALAEVPDHVGEGGGRQGGGQQPSQLLCRSPESWCLDWN